MLGWLDDDHILCLTAGELIAMVTSIETPGGTKAVVVPVAEARAVVVESRRAVGYDSMLTRPGAVGYTVDSAILSGSGPIVVEGPVALRAGESMTVEGVLVTVVDATDEGDTVRVSFGG